MNEMIKKVIKNNVINDLREMKAALKFNTKGHIYCIIKLEDGEYKGINSNRQHMTMLESYNINQFIASIIKNILLLMFIKMKFVILKKMKKKKLQMKKK